MPSLLDFDAQIVFFKSYHRNRVNILLHLPFVPFLTLGFAMFLFAVSLGAKHLNAGSIFCWTSAALYTYLNIEVGFPLALGWVELAYYFSNLYLRLHATQTYLYFTVAAILLVLGFVGQGIGHVKYECKCQLLNNNFIETMWLAPLFMVYELLFLCGFKLEFQRQICIKADELDASLAAQGKTSGCKK